MSKYKKTIRTGRGGKISIDIGSYAKLADPKKLVTPQLREELGDEVESESLELVKVGKSPVAGYGRFEAYAAQRKGKRKYPQDPTTQKNWPGKKTRPVNLTLDPDMPYLKSLFKWKATRLGIEIGRPKDPFLSDLFDAHNQGKNKNVPQRKVIPTGQETFSSSIIRAIKAVYLKRLRRILKGSK